MQQSLMRRRIIALRERLEITQQDLSAALGFKDRQTLSDFEVGKRKLSPQELVLAANFFKVDTTYFTDPFELAGEATFSWRKSGGCDVDSIASFEAKAGRWIATYRHLTRLKGESVNSSMTKVDLNTKSAYEDAIFEGDAVSRALELGDIPALNLVSVLEDKLDTLILHVDTSAGISGAACQLGPLNSIIINRNENEGRRSFDLGHELFHLLTWVAMPPMKVESSDVPATGQYRRIEKLADNFSSGLLMPFHSIKHLIEKNPLPDVNDTEHLINWIKESASLFHVSGRAMKWRLVALKYITQTLARNIPDNELRIIDHAAKRPASFSRKFMTVLAWGIDHGHLSIRRTANILDVTIDDLGDLFAEHGLKAPFDL